MGRQGDPPRAPAARPASRQARSRRRTRPGNAAAEDTISKIVITKISRHLKSILYLLDTCARSPHHAGGRMCSRRSSGASLKRSARAGTAMVAKNLAARAAVPLRPGMCAGPRMVAKAAPVARFGPGLGAGTPQAPLGAPSALGVRPPAWPARTAVDGAHRCGGTPWPPAAWPQLADGKGRLTCLWHRLCEPIPGVRPPVSLQPRPVLQLQCRRGGWCQCSGHVG